MTKDIEKIGMKGKIFFKYIPGKNEERHRKKCENCRFTKEHLWKDRLKIISKWIKKKLEDFDKFGDLHGK